MLRNPRVIDKDEAELFWSNYALLETSPDPTMRKSLIALLPTYGMNHMASLSTLRLTLSAVVVFGPSIAT